MSLLLHSLFDQQSSLFNPFLRGLSDYMDTQIDWKETPPAHVFEIDLPGLSTEDVRLEIHEDRILQVSAERRDTDDEESEDQKSGYKWHCRERSHGGSFTRQFRLPDDAKVDKIKASMRDGVLTVTVPRKEEWIRKKKSNHKHKSLVEISAGDADDDAPKTKGLGLFACCKA